MGRGNYYVLNEDHSVKPAELLEWAEFFEDHKKRIVKQERFLGMRVSTVFIGTDMAFFGGPPQVFETMIFPGSGPAADMYCDRYSTWDEAVAGHARAKRHVPIAIVKTQWERAKYIARLLRRPRHSLHMIREYGFWHGL